MKRPFLPGEKGQSQRPTPIDTDCDLWGSDEEGMDAILLAVSQVTTGSPLNHDLRKTVKFILSNFPLI